MAKKPGKGKGMKGKIPINDQTKSKSFKKTPCGKNPDGSRTHNQCFKAGITVGITIKETKKYTKSELEKTKKGGLEDIGKRVFKIKGVRKKTKNTLITEILAEQNKKKKKK